ncbi:MAG: hypothetical protein M1548_04475 [Actinobacteria bacterium]|nr:hypothetical protein [Actinomycetota bacterium]
MNEALELAVKITREEIPEDFEEFRRFIMETDDGKLVVVSGNEYTKSRRSQQAGLKAGVQK